MFGFGKPKKSFDDEKLELEHKKLLLESERFELEKEKFKKEHKRGNNATVVAIWAAFAGLITNASVSAFNAWQQNVVIEKKAEGDRILEVMKIDDYTTQAINIRFLISSGLIVHYKDQMMAYTSKMIPGTGVKLSDKDGANSLKLSENWNVAPIREEVWASKNLEVEVYNDGTPIKQATDIGGWKNCNLMNEGCWCYYNFNADSGKKYGKLYNWYAVYNDKGIAPAGWHVPGLEVAKKINYDYHIPAVNLKDSLYWLNDPVSDSFQYGNDSTKFSARPGGYCDDNGSFYGVGHEARWWTLSPRTSGGVKDSIYYFYLNDKRNLQWDPMVKGYGFSIRCVKDNTYH